jgi:hypothetical protein
MTKDEMKEIEQRFLKDVENHEMTIRHDDGVYRHIMFKKPESSCYLFEFITFPGGLLYRGDMGTFEFERVYDMFEFFRREDGGALGISPSYWAEKCQASPKERHGGIQEFKSKPVEDAIWRCWKEYFDECDYEETVGIETEVALAVKERIKEAIEYIDTDFEWQWISAVANISFRGIDTHFDTSDLLECLSCGYDYTCQFIWCCYALVWGIEKYFKEKNDEKRS